MANNKSLHTAKNFKNDEWYTRYEDIAEEIEQYYAYDNNVFKDKVVFLPCDDPEWSNFTKYFVANFDRFGIKKLISTCYNHMYGTYQISLFDTEEEIEEKSQQSIRGKIFVMTRGRRNHPRWKYLQGNGDFHSREITDIRDKADVIVTNPPFSLFKEFLPWIEPDKRKFIILGSINAATYESVLPYIVNDKVWLGNRSINKDMYFSIPVSNQIYLVENKKRGSAYEIVNGVVMGRLASACWYTNIDCPRRHKRTEFKTMAENLQGNKALQKVLIKKYGQRPDELHYQKYDVVDAIDVPYVDAIPSDYDGVMGVPITFLGKICPEQYRIIGKIDSGNATEFNLGSPVVHGKELYKRVAIRKV